MTRTVPANVVLVDGWPLKDVLKLVGTVTEAKPGRAVIRGAADSEVSVSGAGGAVVGVLGYEDSPGLSQPADITTAYAVNKQVSVLSGNIYVRLELADAGGITAGASLYAAADGKVSATVSGRIVAVARSSRADAGPIVGQLVAA